MWTIQTLHRSTVQEGLAMRDKAAIRKPIGGFGRDTTLKPSLFAPNQLMETYLLYIPFLQHFKGSFEIRVTIELKHGYCLDPHSSMPFWLTVLSFVNFLCTDGFPRVTVTPQDKNLI